MTKLITILAVAAMACGANAWRLQIFKDKDYGNRFEDKRGNSGTGSNKCYTVSKNDQASSFKWTPCHGEGNWTNARLTLFKDANCKNQIGVATRAANWNVAKMSTNDALTSYRVDETEEHFDC